MSNKTKVNLIYSVDHLPNLKWQIRREDNDKIYGVYSNFDTYASDLTYILVNHTCTINIRDKQGRIQRIIISAK